MTRDEEAVLWSLYDGATVAEVAYDLGMPRQTVGAILSVLQYRRLAQWQSGRRKTHPRLWTLTDAGRDAIVPRRAA